MSIKNYLIELIEPDLREFAKHEKAIRALLPDRKEHRVSFDLIDVDVSMANAFRRTAIEEVDMKALTFDPTTIDTNADYILYDEFLDRIQIIPIKQDIPDDLVMSINVFNASNDNGIMTIYSDSITGGERYIPGRFRIAELRPGNRLKVPKITIMRGFGRKNACFSLTSDYTYRNLDYMDVHVINYKGNRIDKRVKTNEVAKLAGVKPAEAWGKKILVFPNAHYEGIISDHVKEKIALAKYDIILKNKKSPVDDNEYIAEQSSSVAVSREFRMSFYLAGQINPDKFVEIICKNIIDRLTAVKTGIESIYHIKGGGKKLIEPITLGLDTTGKLDLRIKPVIIKHSDESATLDMWNLSIKGETHTLGELIVNHIFAEDPNVPYVTPAMSHLRDDQTTIQLLHPEPEKITLNAIKNCITIFTNLIKQAS